MNCLYIGKINIYFKELAHEIMGDKKSHICRVSWQLENQKELMFQRRMQPACWKSHSCSGEAGLLLLFRPSADCIMEINLFHSKSTDWNFNLIYNTHSNLQNNLWLTTWGPFGPGKLNHRINGHKRYLKHKTNTQTTTQPEQTAF